MIVSWDWLKQYVSLDMSLDELEQRLMMAGLNHEGTVKVDTVKGDTDWAIDLEVTSNRPDWLGHIGVAREVAVLWGHKLEIPAALPSECKTPVQDLTSVSLECPQLCSRYTARIIRGVKIGPSPEWMVRRLATVGAASINNIVDISNYVMLECGQPIHTFDYAKLEGHKIIVRQAKKDEPFEAIDHKTYTLNSGMCVIADAQRPVALAGVMGGADTEISEATTDILIESAAFDPVSVRTTARLLVLHSPSSFRFERRPDPDAVDWASRRCCELILELAGGELAAGVVDVGTKPQAREPIVLRFSQIKRILGIDIEKDTIRNILKDLGNRESGANDQQLEVIPPSWRQDLTREADLIEEVARIHGYDKIPEDRAVPMTVSSPRTQDRVLDKVRHVMTASGFDEAMTVSAVDSKWSEAFNPWSGSTPIRCLTPILRGADLLRQSLIPSLLGARRTNETLSNEVIELFEIAKIYLPQDGNLPIEELMLGIVSGGDFFAVKGVVEGLITSLNSVTGLGAKDTKHELFDPARSCELTLDGNGVGYLGEVCKDGLDQFDLQGPATVAELKVSALIEVANLVPRYKPLPSFPAITRDLNFVVDERVRWADLAQTVTEHGSIHLESVDYQETYRNAAQLGDDKKSLLLTITLRSAEGTLTNEQADAIRDKIVEACSRKHGAQLRA